MKNIHITGKQGKDSKLCEEEVEPESKSVQKFKNQPKKKTKEKKKGKRGRKPAPEITEIIGNRRLILRAYLILFLQGETNVDPKCGISTLAHYLYEYGGFYSRTHKPISYNTLRKELTEIKQELIETKVLEKKSKNY